MSMTLKIGELASSAGVSTDAVRYYERLKIIPRASRTRAGYRVYSEDDIERLRFIKQAQSLGLSLDEIRQLLPGQVTGISECERLRELLSSKLNEIDVKIAEMLGFRKTIAGYLAACPETLPGEPGDSCPVLFEMTHPRTGQRSFSAPATMKKSAPTTNGR